MLAKMNFQFGLKVLFFIFALSVISDANILNELKHERFRRSLAGALAVNGEIALTEDEITHFVSEHNKYRRMDPASNMRLMAWDNDVAAVAKAYANKCLWKHSPADTRKTNDFSVLGENLAMAYAFSPVSRDFIKETTFNWWNETHDFTYSTQICKPGRQCGHYTQVVWADSHKVGCGAAFCQHQFASHSIYVVCNYGPSGK
uniref:SCP domain-containing protein n=1 Tax=Ciona intestinalis TaxID=7719 RepID=F6QD80_CIOIN